MAIINGTINNDDFLFGTADADTISGFAGNDNIRGYSQVGGNNSDDLGDTIDGGPGNDTIDGGLGNDTIIGGSDQDTVYGYDGNDLIVGAEPGDILYGELGDDSFDLNTSVNLNGVIVDGGSGTDSADLAGANVQLGFSLPFTDVEVLDVFGTVFIGTGGNDFYDFRPFSLIAFGGATFLTLQAGNGNDTVFSSNTVLPAGFSHYIDGGSGDDSMTGGNGADDLVGGSGNDTLSGGLGFDALYGGPDNDKITGSDGDSAYGEEGDDHLINTFTFGDQTWDGGTGNDIMDFSLDTLEDIWVMDLSGASFNIWGVTFQNFEHLYGSQGNDTIIGSTIGNDLRGFGGNDRIRGGEGADTIDGGVGNDTADYSDKTVRVSVSVDEFGNGTVKVGGVVEDILSSIEIVTGGSGNDRFMGSASNNTFLGNGGNDTMNGLGGRDLLDGGSGNDVMDGGAGIDRMVGGADNDIYFVDRVSDIVTEDIDAGQDTIYASASYTLRERVFVEVLATISPVSITAIDLTGNSRANTIIGNDGDNILSGKAGKDTIDGGGGEDSFVFDTAFGATNIDTLVNFTVSDDTIVLSSTIFSVLPGGTLSTDAFSSTPAALDATDRIIYDAASNSLLYDEDGSGNASAVTFAKLTGLSGVLTAGDFVII